MPNNADYLAMWEAIRPYVHSAGYELADIRGKEGVWNRTDDQTLNNLRAQVTYHLRKEAGYSREAIADFLHCSVPTVTKRVRREQQR